MLCAVMATRELELSMSRVKIAPREAEKVKKIVNTP